MSDLSLREILEARAHELKRVQDQLDTFIAGCSTGGNMAGADFVRGTKENLHILEMTLRRDIDNLQGAVNELGEVLDKVTQQLEQALQERDKLQGQVDRMENNAKRFKAIAGGKRG